ncbi:MAG TPA: sigma 54-interacting transcriptional regulator [Acidobacteriota bacterium]
MNPRLVAISEKLKGAYFPIENLPFSIGRSGTNRLSLDEASVSRQHSLIENHEGGFKIRDMQSLNHTLVNGVPVKERDLKHGDQIRIGDIVFLFLTEEEEPDEPSHVTLNDSTDVTWHTQPLHRKDALYLSQEKLLRKLPESNRIARDLNTLLKISNSINTIANPEELKSRLLEMIFEVIPAQRGAILIVAGEANQWESVCRYDRPPALHQDIQVSRTVVEQVIREGVSILSNDIASSQELKKADSLMDARISSVLCVPLAMLDRMLGVIYLDTHDPSSRFDDSHLQLCAGIGSIAAVALENARQMQWLEYENRRLQSELVIEHNMVGESAKMRQVYQFIAKVAPTDSTVLVRGESGTGKELVARAIHQNSPRCDKPFVAINCAALTETLLESELFGHEKGSFTGAIAQKKGRLEIAEGGTLFLDEISEIATPLQAKLLRALQEREFERVGGTRPIRVDMRVIAASNREMEEMVRDGLFRQDLYFRLNVVSLTVPPLRDRREDIPLLAGYFVEKYSSRTKRRVKGITPKAGELLKRYEWPGNVRELENAIERAVVLGSGELILPEDLPETILEAQPESGGSPAGYHGAIREAKKRLILNAVEKSGGNYTEAAKALGVHPNYLHRLIKNLNLKAQIEND